ncbi:stemmadenine O-acetyltransferase-like [Mercurialis annua]|uniref:stemmadenine O-acetyltransferase-like n=1 Tax=Mercurialis annua TaxID=3986 RepID=UPI00215FCD57|nr:stemmadenine O-acetyltransferase-like [Mercurialis annua]
MTMEVEIIYNNCIKPSSPTPFHLKIHDRSLLDQLAPFIYSPMILYYSNPGASNKTLLLKQSLSQTLTKFYPLAGKIRDDMSIECNDEGVLYSEARASVSLLEFLKHPNMITKIHELLPIKSLFHIPTSGSYVTMIQETTFGCGGFTIGINVLHSVMDGCALSAFLKVWGAMASNETDKKMMIPSFDSQSIFPKYKDVPKDVTIMALVSSFIRVEKMNAVRFVFNGSAIANLQEKVTSSGVKNPTRVEVVSALVSERLMAAFKSKYGNNNNYNPLAINHVVNIRRKTSPTIPECSMGNIACLADTILFGETQLSSLVFELKEAIAKINSGYVKNIQGEEGSLNFFKKIKEMKDAFTSPLFCSGVDYVMFTSWCGFGLYEVDFGWGKPVWTTCGGSYGNFKSPFFNLVVLMDARTRNDGIEAWVISDERTIVEIEKDEELLKYAYLNPTPIFH